MVIADHAQATGSAAWARASLVERARSLESLIVAERDEAERRHTLTQPVVDALYEAGVFSTFVPRDLGGLEVEPLEWLAMVEELSRIDASVGWLAMINAGTFAQFLTPTLFAKLAALTGGRFIVSQNFGRRAGIAKRVDGGYRISGRWPFVSGSPHATWVGGASVLHDDNDEVVIHPDGLPWIVGAIWPQHQATLVDTWDGLGLRATGSGDMVIEDLFVPDEQVNHLGMHNVTYDRPLYRVKEMLFMAHAAHAIGIACAAQEAFLAETRRATLRGSVRQEALGHLQQHQIVFARSDALVKASRAFMIEAVRAAYESAASNPGRPLDFALRVQFREAMIFAVRSAKEAVDLVFESAGSAAVYSGRALERAHRDICTAANHIIVTETEYASIGSYHLTKHFPHGPSINGRKFFLIGFGPTVDAQTGVIRRRSPAAAIGPRRTNLRQSGTGHHARSWCAIRWAHRLDSPAVPRRTRTRHS